MAEFEEILEITAPVTVSIDDRQESNEPLYIKAPADVDIHVCVVSKGKITIEVPAGAKLDITPEWYIDVQSNPSDDVALSA